MATLPRTRSCEPVLVMVTTLGPLVVVMARLPKSMAVGLRTGFGPTPVPLRTTSCWRPGASSVNISPPDLGPTAVGLKTTVVSQKLPGCSTLAAEHVLDEMEKSPGWAPVTATAAALNVNGAAPVFVKRTVCDGLVVPTP